MNKQDNIFNDPTLLEVAKTWVTMNEENECFSKCMKENYHDVQDCDDCKEKGNTKEQAEKYCKKQCEDIANGA